MSDRTVTDQPADVTVLRRRYDELAVARDHLLTQPIDYQVWSLADGMLVVARDSLAALEAVTERPDRSVTDLETTALEADEFLRRFDEAARADLSTGRGKLGASWDHMEALITAVRELARQLRDLKGFCKAADEDAKAAEAEAQTLRDALEQIEREAEAGEVGACWTIANGALATPDTPPDDQDGEDRANADAYRSQW